MGSTTGHQFSGPELKFEDLLKQARQQHRQEGARPAGETTTARSPSGGEISDNLTDQDTVTESHQETQEEIQKESSKESNAKSKEQSQLESQEKSQDESHEVVNSIPPQDNLETTSLKPTTTKMSQYQELPRSSDNEGRNHQDLQIIDKEESVASGEDSDDLFDQFADDFQISETRSRLSVFTTEAVDTTEKIEDYYDELGTTTKSYEYQDDFSKPERTPKVIRNEKDESLDISLSDVETKSETETPSEGLLKDDLGYYQHDATGDTAEPYVHDQRGQYREIHPGQYTELHPGQYEEQHPGQYHEVNPGQYTLDDEDIEVVVDNRDNESRIYNVRANAGDFIIGEAGRIDINSGQTVEGVRYTAVESEVDYEKIKEILDRYFGGR